MTALRSACRRSDFLQVLHQVDEEEDINKVLRYFSYEHFYVIYCKFWDLDTGTVRIDEWTATVQICVGAQHESHPSLKHEIC